MSYLFFAIRAYNAKYSWMSKMPRVWHWYTRSIKNGWCLTSHDIVFHPRNIQANGWVESNEVFHMVNSSGLTKETILTIKSLKAYSTCLLWSITQNHLGGKKKRLPEWKNAAAMPWYCHDHIMILLWSYHEQGETWSWSCHDDGMAAMFCLAWSSCFMAWLPWFPWFIPWS